MTVLTVKGLNKLQMYVRILLSEIYRLNLLISVSLVTKCIMSCYCCISWFYSLYITNKIKLNYL